MWGRSDAVLKVMVERGDGGALEPIACTALPTPTIQGSMFDTDNSLDISMEGDSYGPDVMALQRFLVANGYKTNDIVDGEVGENTDDAIKLFQQACGLTCDGICGPLTKKQLSAPTYDKEPHTTASVSQTQAALDRTQTAACFSRGQV
jgi:peptidoglycan hydrolase-like protein with peptidoglycan-binding domain